MYVLPALTDLRPRCGRSAEGHPAADRQDPGVQEESCGQHIHRDTGRLTDAHTHIHICHIYPCMYVQCPYILYVCMYVCTVPIYTVCMYVSTVPTHIYCMYACMYVCRLIGTYYLNYVCVCVCVCFCRFYSATTSRRPFKECL